MNWTEHKAKWIACRRCVLCKDRFSVCLLRGEVPAQILFIGEGPGPCEDGIGKPFIGPAGEILQETIDSTIGKDYTYALTNIVGCMPLNEDKTKYADPPDWAIEACAPRVKEIIEIVKPKLIFRVGKLAQKHVDKADYREIQFRDLMHPGAILKMQPVMRPLPIQRIEADIAAAVGDWLNK